MGQLSPKVERSVFGLLFCLALSDLTFRSVTPLVTVCNEGIAFGLSIPEFVLWPAISLFLLAILFQWRTASLSSARLAWGAVFLGGLTNAIDRFLNDCVHDYLTLPLFPSFNLADMMLFLGVLYLLGQMTRRISTEKTYVS